MKNFFLGHPWRSLVIFAAILIGGYFLLVNFYPKKTTNQYQTAKVAKGTIVASVSVTGLVSTANTYSVTTSLGGVVKNIYVKNGDTVTSGEKILEIDPQDSDKQKSQAAYSAYLTAVNSLNSAKQAKEVQAAVITGDKSKLLTAQLIEAPTSGWDPTDKNKQKIDYDVRTAELTLQSDQNKLSSFDNQIAQVQVAVSAAFLSYQQTQPVVTASVNGVLSGLTVSTGTVLTASAVTSATATTQSSTTKLAYIKVPGNPQLTLNISEVDIAKINEGQKATITLDAFGGKTFTGKVTAIDQVGTVTSGVTNYPVIVTLDDTVLGILPNMNSSVSIITATKADVLTVPTSAVQNGNGMITVRELRNNQLVNVPVEVGLSDDTNYEVVSGLNEGDTVVTAIISNSTATSTGTSLFGGVRIGGFGGGGNRGTATGR